MSDWFALVLVAAITVRVTLLVTRDDLFAGLRAWADRKEALPPRVSIEDRDNDGEPFVMPEEPTIWVNVVQSESRPWYGWWVGKITGCNWCCSPYCAGGAVIAWWLLPEPVFMGMGMLCAAALAAGLIGEWLE